MTLATLPDPAILATVERFAAELAPRSRAEYVSALRAVRVSIQSIRGTELPDDVALLRHLVAGGRSNAFLLVHDLRSHWLDRGLAPATISLRLVAIRKVLGFARQLGAISWEIEVRGVKAQAKRDMRGPNELEYESLLLACREPREVAAVRLLGDAGLRTEEAVSICLGAVERNDSGAVVALNIRRKGMRTGTTRVTVYGRLSAVLREVFEAHGARPKAEERLLSLSRPGLRTMFERIARRAGVKARPHGLRHRAATVAAEVSGGDIVAVSAFLGHRDPRTTMRYMDRASEAADRVARLMED